jgi:peptidoglycan/LPS O-acetylase OafA/YrhL
MFYVFVPVAGWLAWRAARRRVISVNALALGIVAIYAGSVAWRIGVSVIVPPRALVAGTVPWSHEILGWLLPAFLCAFAPGAFIFVAETLAADQPGRVWAGYRWAKRNPGLMLAAALALGMACTLLTERGGRWFQIGTPALAIPAGFGLVAMMGESRRKLALGRILGPIGLISYGIYLWHAVIRNVILHHDARHIPLANAGPHAWPFHAGLLIGLTIPAALGSWLLIERPLLRMTTNWDRRRRAAPAAAEASLPAPATS